MRKILIVLVLAMSACTDTTNPQLEKEVEQWYEARIAELKSDDGFIDLAGLFWLKNGENTFGSDASNYLVFPADFPGDAGTLTLADSGYVYFTGEKIFTTLDGDTLTSGQQLFGPDLVVNVYFSNYWFYIIERAGEYGLRLKDKDHPNLSAELTIPRYPVNQTWVVEADFIPYDPPKAMPIQNIVGQVYNVSVPGQLVFEKEGKQYTLEPTVRGQEYFITFGDETNGEETYGAGRYVYAPIPQDGGPVIIDFNKSYNPPCAFTEFATCPLPPPQNQLALAIEAGEKEFHWDDH